MLGAASGPLRIALDVMGVVYCNNACQKKEWPLHKQICKLFQNMSPRSSREHRLVIAFGQDEGLPVLQWMYCEGTNYHNDMAACFHSLYSVTTTEKNPRIGKKLYPGYTVYSEEEGLLDSVSVRNKSIQLVTKGKCPHKIIGPVLLCRDIGKKRGMGFFSDVTPTTFRHFSDNIMHGFVNGIVFQIPIDRPRPASYPPKSYTLV